WALAREQHAVFTQRRAWRATRLFDDSLFGRSLSTRLRSDNVVVLQSCRTAGTSRSVDWVQKLGLERLSQRGVRRTERLDSFHGFVGSRVQFLHFFVGW